LLQRLIQGDIARFALCAIQQRKHRKSAKGNRLSNRDMTKPLFNHLPPPLLSLKARQSATPCGNSLSYKDKKDRDSITANQKKLFSSLGRSWRRHADHSGVAASVQQCE